MNKSACSSANVQFAITQKEYSYKCSQCWLQVPGLQAEVFVILLSPSGTILTADSSLQVTRSHDGQLFLCITDDPPPTLGCTIWGGTCIGERAGRLREEGVPALWSWHEKRHERQRLVAGLLHILRKEQVSLSQPRSVPLPWYYSC